MKTRLYTYILLLIGLLLLSSCRDEVRSEPYFTKLITMIEAGNPPDVGFIDSLRAASYINQGILKEIPADLVDKDYYPQLLSYFQRDGKTYALPRDFQTEALLINLDLFEQAGVELPKDWNSFAEAARKITDPASGIHGVGLIADFFNFAPFLLQADPKAFNPDGSHFNLRTDAARNALNFYADLYKNGFVFDQQGEWPFMGIYDPNGLVDQFIAGKVGMFLVWPTMYDQVVQRAYGKIRMQLLELPAGPAGKATIAYVVGFGLFKEPNDARVKFLEYVTGPEGMEIWFNPQGLGLNPPVPTPAVYMPARISMRDEWYKSHPDAAAFMDGVDYLTGFPIVSVPFSVMTDFDQQANPIIREFLAGNSTVDDALGKLEVAGDALLRK